MTRPRLLAPAFACLALLVISCSEPQGGFDNDGSVDSGGAGGIKGSGGGLGSGGAQGTGGGSSGSGGFTGSGGDVGSGGMLGSGGDIGSGGFTGSGGDIGSGGMPGSGGDIGSGGMLGSGGDIGSGGTPGSGGALGSGGTMGSGGMPGSGGALGSGGTMGSGGTPGSGGRDLMNLILNEEGFTVSGKVTVNGATPTKDTSYCGASGNLNDQIVALSFSELTKGYTANVSITCSTTDFSFNAVLPPGTWQVRVSPGSYATSASVNLLPVSYLVNQVLVVNGPVSGLILDEQGYTVSGKVTVNGATPTKDTSYCGASGNLNDQIVGVTFSEPTLGYTAYTSIRCSTTDFSFSTLLPPGTWDVQVYRGSYATAANVNLLPVDYLAKRGLVVNGPVSGLILDEQGYTVSGKVTVNGAMPTKDTSYCGASGNLNDQIVGIAFSEPTLGYTANISIRCSTTDFSFSTLLPLGTWDVRVYRGSYATSAKVNLLPVNYRALRGLVVNAPVSGVILDETGYTVSGKVTVNGAMPTKDTTYCSASGNLNDQIVALSFTDSSQGYSASISIPCSTTDFSFSTTLPAGTWDIRAARGSYASSAKVNLLPVSYLVKQGLIVGAPISGLLLDEQGYQVSGKVTVAGSMPAKDAGYCGASANLNDQIALLTFVEPSKGYTATLSILCSTPDFSFNTLLPQGTWEIRISRGAYANSAKVNLLPVNYLTTSNLVVNGGVTGLVLDELGYTVSGHVTVNGAMPTKDASYCAASANLNDEIVSITFSDPFQQYTATVAITCSTTDFGFTTVLPPGVWEAWVSRGSYATSAKVNLMPLSYLALWGLAVP